MEKSFELLSTMSPKVKGRQKTLKVMKSSKLALRKHFRRSSIYDKSIGIRNKNISIVEVNTSSSGSLPSCRDVAAGGMNEIVIIDSSDSEDDIQNRCPEVKLRSSPSSTAKVEKTRMIKKWLDDAEKCDKDPSFFTQVSTVYGDYTANIDKDGNHIAACSSFNDYLTHRFDELFIDSKKDSQNAKNADLSDDSISLEINTSLTTRLRKIKSIKENNYSDTTSIRIISGEPIGGKENLVVGDALLTDDESDLIDSVKSSDNLPLLNLNPENVPQYPTTPSDQNIEHEVKVLLDSIYGKSWRANQRKVLMPISERKQQNLSNKRVAGPVTERTTKTSIKSSNLKNTKLTQKKLNFDTLNTPANSPWVGRLKGRIDSDSVEEDNNAKDIEKVKTRLNFGESNSTKKGANSRQDQVKAANVEQLGKGQKRNENKAPINNKNSRNKSDVEKGSTTHSKRIMKPRTESPDSLTTDEEYDKEIEMLELTRTNMSSKKNKVYNFLESLSASVPLNKCDISARLFRTNFKQHKEVLVKKLFLLFNEKVFDNGIPADLKIEWNTKLRKTAGLCHYKKITHSSGRIERQVKISLSTKVLDCPCRLRDTLIHEMCHAATFIINNMSDGHGAYWKSWAFKAMEQFPELPPIRRCHDYRINSKYTYKCTGCHYSFGRHTKSLDMDRKRCGYCMGKFEVYLNKKIKGGDTKAVPIAQRKEVTGFPLFVKENYAKYKEPSKTHGDIMKVLSGKFAELKLMNVK